MGKRGSEKPRAFWLHYNKPASASEGRNVLTVHYAGKCELVTDVVCGVLIQTRHRKQQPRCVLAGKGVVRFTPTAGGGRRATITSE